MYIRSDVHSDDKDDQSDEEDNDRIRQAGNIVRGEMITHH